MDDWDDSNGWDNDPNADSALAAPHFGQPQITAQLTTKVPPAYNGRTSWFAYEEAIDDWLDITELEPAKRGPALKKRLEDEASIHRPM